MITCRNYAWIECSVQELRKRPDSNARSSDGEILNDPAIRDMLEKEFGVI
ncbi:MAG TPA: hypothetical protein PKK48_03835 [Phycisphaerae bacterium]|nr:hypothetical protein [Phycisphaerae bacterium]HPS52327.1 hypothetical protein [Phycisphaerae bacterium]